MEKTLVPATGRMVKNEDTEGAFKTQPTIFVPYRPTPSWLSQDARSIICKCHLQNVAQGKLGVGLLPNDAILNDAELKMVLHRLSRLAVRKYEGTASEQKVGCVGTPFVDSPSVTSHLSKESGEEEADLTQFPLRKVADYLRNLGFDVADLIDPVTLLPYSAGVFRTISVTGKATVLHCDDFIRDGLKKPDFRLPEVLEGRMFHQMSFNILLDDGGFQPDPLYVYNRFYNTSDEKHCLENGWQFPLSLVEAAAVCKYQPEVGSTYVFSTTNYHDIRGGSVAANRVTWSVFALYVPSLNLMLLYN
jgi:hypothetical protein